MCLTDMHGHAVRDTTIVTVVLLRVHEPSDVCHVWDQNRRVLECGKQIPLQPDVTTLALRLPKPCLLKHIVKLKVRVGSMSTSTHELNTYIFAKHLFCLGC